MAKEAEMRVEWLAHEVNMWTDDGGHRLVRAGDIITMPDEEAHSRAEQGQVRIIKDAEVEGPAEIGAATRKK
jgi:hypothetical protein